MDSPDSADAADGAPVFTVMVVDDHLRVRQTIMELVERRFPQCRLLGAECAEDALALCAAQRLDVIVLDIKLPGMDGFEAARRIKALSPATRIVMHSSSDQGVYRDASIAAGASAFVGKGGRSSRALVPVIASLLPQPPVAPASA